MRMLPSTVASSTRSAAERRLFALLQRLDFGPHTRALHSLGIPEHISKPMGEADFVVIGPDGLLVIEVKGGRLRREADGSWFQGGNPGWHRLGEGPFVQAQTAMWSIRDGLVRRLGGRRIARVSVGYAVAFPDIEYEDADCLEAPLGLVLDRNSLRDERAAKKALRRLFAYWSEATGKATAPFDVVDEISRELRRSFDLAIPLTVRREEMISRLESLTDEQYAGLDWTEDHPRLLVGGGAGTGKTMLAVESARREATAGRRVLFTCRSHVLAAFVAGRKLPAGIEVMPIDVAVKAITAGTEPFETVIVDEAQDVFTTDGLDALESLVRGGVDAGRWRCFFDLNNQAGFYGALEPAVIDLLKIAASGPVLRLRRNCRNPRPVVIETRAVTGADLGAPLDGAGQPVSFVFPGNDREEAELLARELRRLGRSGIAAGSISVLSARPFATSPARLLPQRLRDSLRVVDASNAGSWPPTAMTFLEIDDFKGLENDVVLICGLERLTDYVVDRARLYVAMSRPRFALWMAVPSRLGAEFEQLKKRHIETMIGAA